MKRTLTSLAALVSLVAVFGCDQREAGNTTQTENTIGTLALRIDSVLPLWNRPVQKTTVVTLRLDERNFKFADVDSLGRNLAVFGDKGDTVSYHVAYWDKAALLGRVLVRVDSQMLIPGSNIVVSWGPTLRNRSNPTVLWHGIPDSQKLALSTVLVDDFELNPAKSRLPNGATWYSVPSDSTASVSAPGLVAAGAGRSGKAMHISYNAPSTTYKYSLLGIALCGPSTYCDLRSLDSLVVWVRGSGTLHIALDRLNTKNKGKAWTSRALDSNWVRLRIRPQDFDPPSNVGNNVGWDAVSDSVSNLTFLVSGGAHFYVDDIRFYGVDRDDLD